MEVMSLEELFGEVISTYTRAQALEDGVLVDVDKLSPTMRAELGFKFPIALTQRLFEEVIKPDATGEANCQSIEGRLWDTLWMLLNGIKGMGRTYNGPGPCQTTEYPCGFWLNGRVKELTLKAICGPGDEGEPVITIMLPDED